MGQKSILITGCSTGIGYYCAKALQKEGFRVFATARKKEDVEKLRQEGLESYQLDLNDSGSIQIALDEILEQSGGKLYALFNNGAYGQPGAVEDLSRDVLKAQFETNLFGTHELTIKVLPIMRKQGYGRIIQNSSVLGIIALRYRGAYNASKFALEGLSDTLRLELENTNIFISLIEPGPVRSDFRKNALAKFIQNIDRENTPYKEIYHDKLSGLESTEDVPFTLGEDAVFDALLHALSAKTPKERYRVTKPTTIFWFLKRILSTKLLDKVLRKVE
ncbi:MAG TPA: SDR family oxidoreductase [Campylobacterales bacterium]|nr:SDR family oxidoreductase [Campylobacterales bacterium]